MKTVFKNIHLKAEREERHVYRWGGKAHFDLPCGWQGFKYLGQVHISKKLDQKWSNQISTQHSDRQCLWCEQRLNPPHQHTS